MAYQHPANSHPYLRGLHYAMEFNGIGQPVVRTQESNGFGTDLFGRSKISQPFTLFDSQHRYKESGDFSNATNGSGNVAHDANASLRTFTISSTSGDYVYSETKRVFPYQPGKSLQVLQTFVFAEGKEGLRQRAGYFTTGNGVYLELDGTDLYLIKRSSSSGVLDETEVLQTNWNLDTLDGTGPSGLTLDISKAQIFWQEYEWLGVGSVRCGFAINGVFVAVHQFDHANSIESTYMTTAALPLRYEIENTSGTASNSSMKQICATVISNGGYNRSTENWTATRSTGVSTSGTVKPLVALRMASGRTDSVIVPGGVAVGLEDVTGVVEWQIIRNPSSLTGASYVTHPNSTNVQYDVSANAISGGSVVRSGIITSSNQGASSIDIGDSLSRFDLQLGRTITGTSDVLVLAVRALNGSPTAYGSLSWFDLL